MTKEQELAERIIEINPSLAKLIERVRNDAGIVGVECFKVGLAAGWMLCGSEEWWH